MSVSESIITSVSDIISSADIVSVTDAVTAATVNASAPLILRLIAIVIAGVFTENLVLNKFLGCCPFLGVSKKLETAVGMSAAVTFVMILATLVTYPIYALLAANDLEFLQTLVFILVIAALVQLVEIVLKKHMPALYRSLGIYLPLITTNCAVLGVTILVTGRFSDTGDYTFFEGYLSALFTALGGGLGFLAAMVLFAGVRQRLEDSDIPRSLQGAPITLIAAAIVAMSFLGFAGLVK